MCDLTCFYAQQSTCCCCYANAPAVLLVMACRWLLRAATLAWGGGRSVRVEGECVTLAVWWWCCRCTVLCLRVLDFMLGTQLPVSLSSAYLCNWQRRMHMCAWRTHGAVALYMPCLFVCSIAPIRACLKHKPKQLPRMCMHTNIPITRTAGCCLAPLLHVAPRSFL